MREARLLAASCRPDTHSLHNIQHTELPEDRDLVHVTAASPTQAQLGDSAGLTPDHHSIAGIALKQVVIFAWKGSWSPYFTQEETEVPRG